MTAAATGSSHHLAISPNLSVEGARRALAPKLSRPLPKGPGGTFNLHMGRLDQWSWWRTGGGVFVLRTLPAVVLVLVLGSWVDFGLPYVWLKSVNHAPWQFTLALTAGLLVLYGLTRNRNRVPGADKSALIVLAFMAGSEEWSRAERRRAAFLYAIWLQRSWVFPVISVPLAMLSQLAFGRLYRRRLASGYPVEEALSYVVTARTTAMMMSVAFYSVFPLLYYVMPRLT